VLAGLDETDLIAYGGALAPVTLAAGAQAPLTFVPPRPTFPPEAIWSEDDHTDLPALVLREGAGGRGRTAHLLADLDRRYARDNLPDHGDLLANLIRWAAADELPLQIDGPGLIDCHLYRQPGRLILHCVNLTNPGAWRAPVDELYPVGPLRVRVRLPGDLTPRRLRLLVGSARPALKVERPWARFDLPSLLDHEVAVLE
jgi:hypothetical protein